MDETRVAAEVCTALGAGHLTLAAYPNRDARLGNLRIARALPIRDRRLVGPWCFLDRFGPLSFGSGRPMNVPPHPHIGLQTVSWLLEGEVLHADSLGNEAMVRPGGVNVMTAGRGIAHAEETPTDNSGRLSGVQLWVALPDGHRDVEPSFDHVDRVPLVEARGGLVQVVAGSLIGSGSAASPARHFSELIALDVQVFAGEAVDVGLSPGFEHAALLLDGDCAIESQRLEARTLYYLGTGRSSLALGSESGGRLLLVGGPPFPEPILMWWNFVARTPEEISRARADWEEHRRFGEVPGPHAARLAAPPLMRFARPNPLS
jgi:quercetin 2,3-dioxygenase